MCPQITPQELQELVVAYTDEVTKVIWALTTRYAILVSKCKWEQAEGFKVDPRYEWSVKSGLNIEIGLLSRFRQILDALRMMWFLNTVDIYNQVWLRDKLVGYFTLVEEVERRLLEGQAGTKVGQYVSYVEREHDGDYGAAGQSRWSRDIESQRNAYTDFWDKLQQAEAECVWMNGAVWREIYSRLRKLFQSRILMRGLIEFIRDTYNAEYCWNLGIMDQWSAVLRRFLWKVKHDAEVQGIEIETIRSALQSIYNPMAKSTIKPEDSRTTTEVNSIIMEVLWS